MFCGVRAGINPAPTHHTPLPLEGGSEAVGFLLIIENSSCALIAVVVVVLVDIRDRDAIGAGGVDELEVTVALNLCHNTYMVDAGGRAKEHRPIPPAIGRDCCDRDEC